MNRAACPLADSVRPLRASPSFRGLRQFKALWLAGALAVAAGPSADAQTSLGTTSLPATSSVRENEFRSRWADYQVDRPLTTAPRTEGDAADTPSGGLLSALGKSFNDHFRDGPLQLRATLSAGWEFTNEASLRAQKPDGTDNSPFVSPALAVFYNLELGPVTVSARYSAGYVYYLDSSYYGANRNGGILSETAGLDLSYAANRVTVSSGASAAYGNGNDIESGTFRDRFTITETLVASYLLTDFTQLGAQGDVSYQTYTGGGVADTDEFTLNGKLYGDYVITGKSRLRLEFGAGEDQQSSNAALLSSRTYYQFLLGANYVPSPKLSFDGSLGYGFQDDSAVVNRGGGSHPVYSITASYAPTEKTSLSLHFGYEGAALSPEFLLLAQWQPRPNTTVGFSVYQRSNFSTYVVAQDVTTRGILATIQQRLFEKVELDLSNGAEQTRGYSQSKASAAASTDPYYFVSISALWQINTALALQSYYRGFTNEPGIVASDQGWQSRASISLRLTF